MLWQENEVKNLLKKHCGKGYEEVYQSHYRNIDEAL